MQKTFILLSILVATTSVYAQDFQSDFNKFFSKSDTIMQRKILQEWSQVSPKDPELFTSYFNYYFNQSRQEVLTLMAAPHGDEVGLEISDSNGNAVGFFGSQIVINDSIMQLGLDKIDEGIAFYPNRLDMRFGKIYALGQIEDWERFTQEIIMAIEQSNINKNNWLWTNNESNKDGEAFFLASLQDYQLNLFDTEEDSLLINMRLIANKVLEYYPNHIESLSNLAVTYMLTLEFSKALVPLLKAEKLDAKDPIVLSNIAYCYMNMGENKMAIDYYSKTKKYGDDNMAEFAKEKIKQLKKK